MSVGLRACILSILNFDSRSNCSLINLCNWLVARSSTYNYLLPRCQKRTICQQKSFPKQPQTVTATRTEICKLPIWLKALASPLSFLFNNLLYIFVSAQPIYFQCLWLQNIFYVSISIDFVGVKDDFEVSVSIKMWVF